MGSQLPNGKQQFVTILGTPLVGGKVYFYQPGTETPKTTYQDSALTIPNANPVVLDARGQAVIWGTGAYRQVLVDAFGVQIWDQVVEDLSADVQQITDNLAAPGGSSLVGFVQIGSGAIDRTVQDELRDRVSVKQFGAKGDGVTDDTASILAAIATGRAVYLPNGTYVMSNTVFTTGMTLIGEDKFNTVIRWKSASAEDNLFGFNAAVVDVSISNLTIDSNQAAQTDSTEYYGAFGGSLGNGACIAFNNVVFRNGRISDIYISGPTGTNQYASFSARNCLFTNGLVGNLTRAAQAVGLSEGWAIDFSDNQMIQDTAPSTYGRGGLVVQRPSGDTATSFADISVKDNYFLNFGISSSNILGCVYIYSGAEQVVISGNLAKNSYGIAYCVKADSGNVVIANNSAVNNIDANGGAINFFNQAVPYTESVGVNLVIEGNVITGAQAVSIFVDGGRPNSLPNFSNIVVANNACNGGQYGIHYRNVTNARFSGNVIQNTTAEAIFGEAEIGDVSITDNTIAGGLVGIDINGTTSSANLEISRNIITALTAAAIRLKTAVNSFYINDNIIAGCTQAFTTTGATASSTIRFNNVSGETAAWTYSGTYGPVDYRDNIFSVASLSFAQRSLAMDATGAITVIADIHYVDTFNSAASGNLVTINGAYDGRRLTLFAASTARVVTLVPDTGNLKLASNFALTGSSYCIQLIARGGVWYELSRSSNT